MDGAIARAIELVAQTPGAFMPQQFDNRANPETHANTTAREILHALGGARLDAFVSAVGTGGTVSGVGSILKSEGHGSRIIAVEPESSATLSRGERGPSKIQGIAAGFVPGEAAVFEYMVNVKVLWAHPERGLNGEPFDKGIGLLIGSRQGKNDAVQEHQFVCMRDKDQVLTYSVVRIQKYFMPFFVWEQ